MILHQLSFGAAEAALYFITDELRIARMVKDDKERLRMTRRGLQQ
jgi:hypothetical protein